MFAASLACYLPFSSYSTHIATSSIGMMYFKPHIVFVFILAKVCMWNLTHRAIAVVFVGGKPPWPTYRSSAPCGNYPLWLSRLSYPSPPSHICYIPLWGIQVAPAWRFANNPTSQYFKKKLLPIIDFFIYYNKHILVPTMFSKWLPSWFNPICFHSSPTNIPFNCHVHAQFHKD